MDWSRTLLAVRFLRVSGILNPLGWKTCLARRGGLCYFFRTLFGHRVDVNHIVARKGYRQ
jgi:hypothetical protein